MKIELSQHGSPRSRPTPPHGEAGSFGRAAQDEAGTSPLAQQGHLCHQGPHATHLYATGLEDLTCSSFPTAGFTEDRHTASRPGAQPRRVVASRHLDRHLPTSSAHVARFYKQQIKHGSAALPRGGVFNRGTPTGESTGAHWKGETSQTCIRIRAPRRPRGRQRPLGEALRGGGDTPPRPTNPACPSSRGSGCLSQASPPLPWREGRARVGEEEGAAPNRNRGFGNFLGSQRTYALFPRGSTEEAPRPPGAPGDGARTDARLPEASGCGSGVAFPLVSSSGSTRRSRGDRGRLRPRRRLSDGGSQAPWPTVPRGISFRSFDGSACASGREKASDRAKRDAEAKPPGPGGTPRSSGRRPRAQGRGKPF